MLLLFIADAKKYNVRKQRDAIFDTCTLHSV